MRNHCFNSAASHLNPQSTLGAINRQHLILTLTARVNLHSPAAVALNLSHRGFTAPRINVSLTGGAISCVVRGAGKQESRGAGEQGSRRAGEQGSRGAGGQGSREQEGRRAGEQESRRAGEQGSRGAGGQGSRRAGEQGGRGAGEQEGRGAGEQESRGGGEQESRRAGEQGEQEEQGSRGAGEQEGRRTGEQGSRGAESCRANSGDRGFFRAVIRVRDDSQVATEASLKGRVTEEVGCCCRRPCQARDSQPSPALKARDWTHKYTTGPIGLLKSIGSDGINTFKGKIQTFKPHIVVSGNKPAVLCVFSAQRR